MKSAALTALCLCTLACKEDPARSVKIVPRPAVSAPAQSPPAESAQSVPAQPAPPPAVKPKPESTEARVAHPPKPAPAPAKATPIAELPPQIEFCPPAAEDSTGPGTFIATGPCRFEQKTLVSCEGSPDDYYAAVTRQAKQGATLVTYVNVENYKGPGTYDGTQMFVTVQSGSTILRWSSDNVHATVSLGETYVDIPMTRLDAEPTLLDCTILLGKSTNYQYQCGKRSTEKIAIASDPLTVSGRLACAPKQ